MKRLFTLALIAMAATLGGCSTDVVVRTCGGDISCGSIEIGNDESSIFTPFKPNAPSVVVSTCDCGRPGSMIVSLNKTFGAQSDRLMESFDIDTQQTIVHIHIDGSAARGLLARDQATPSVAMIAEEGKTTRLEKAPGYEYDTGIPIYRYSLGFGRTLDFILLGRPVGRPRAVAVNTRIRLPLPVLIPRSIVCMPGTIAVCASLSSEKPHSLFSGFHSFFPSVTFSCSSGIY